MKQVVGLEAVTIPAAGRSRLIIQNLGPGTVYMGTDGSPTTPDSGLRINVNSSFEFSTPMGTERGVSLISDAIDTDVRIETLGER